MKARPYHINYFSSYEEYETYCRCVSKIELGDTVHIYAKDNIGGGNITPSNQKTDIIREAKIIGVGVCLNHNFGTIKKVFLLGAYVSDFSFWGLCRANVSSYAPYIKDVIPNYDGCLYGWSVQSFSDVKFARIIK
jgi:hypothetical protein